MSTARRTAAAAAISTALVFCCCAPSAEAQQVGVIGDAYLTPATGALNLITIQHVLAAIEDRFVPLKFGAERTNLGLATGILYRAAKFTALDVPQDHMLLVVQHELFGHGARLRELGVGRIGYGFDAPIPYGPGGGVTHFNGTVPDSPLAILAIESAGIEAQHSLSDGIGERALGTRRFHYREAWLYFESRYIALTYILDATDVSREGNDVADFARTMTDACTAPACRPISLHDLKRGARLMLADPLLYFAVYGFAGSYVGLGEKTSPIPMIPVGRGVRYLPSMGFEMTPYGTEWSLRSSFTSGARGKGQRANVTSVTLRVGRTGATRPWGVDVRMPGVMLPRIPWRVRPAFSIWRQPFFLADQTSAPLRTGAAATATFVMPLPQRIRSMRVDGIYVTTGVKSDGFIPGEQLSGGAILKIGLTLQVQ